MQQFNHRSALPGVNEHQGSEEQYYGYQHQYQYQSPLPAPTPQRMNGQSYAVALESNSEHTHARRPVHHRSQSDMGGLSRGHYEYPTNAPSIYSQEGTYQPRLYAQQNSPQLGASSYQPPQQRYEPMPYTEMRQPRQYSGYGHHRAQSSSVVQSGYSPAMPSLREHPSQAHLSPYNQHQAALPQVPHVTEAQEARSLFNPRN